MTPREDQPTDSPVGWVNKHAERYLASDGKDGHDWRGVPTLLLTVTGRRSGQLRRTPLIYGRDGEDYLVVASQGGKDVHPSWFLNLEADPDVEIQVGPDRMPATASVVDSDDKPRTWSIMTAVWPDYDVYQRRTDRDIPVVRLRPQA